MDIFLILCYHFILDHRRVNTATSAQKLILWRSCRSGWCVLQRRRRSDTTWEPRVSCATMKGSWQNTKTAVMKYTLWVQGSNILSHYYLFSQLRGTPCSQRGFESSLSQGYSKLYLRNCSAVRPEKRYKEDNTVHNIVHLHIGQNTIEYNNKSFLSLMFLWFCLIR